MDEEQVPETVRRRVLCVQPNRDLERTVRAVLSHHELTIVASGLDALRALNAAPYDGYVLSFWLPDWAGLSLCREIRKTDPHVPVCMSAEQNEDHERRALRAGADAYFCGEGALVQTANRLETLLAHVERRCASARVERQRVVREEIRRRAAGGLECPGEWPRAVVQSLERTARMRAAEAFVAAGGTLASFNREWQDAFAAAAAEEGLTLPTRAQGAPDGLSSGK